MATSYNVWLGLAAGSMALVAEGLETSEFDLSSTTLEYDTTYYWRVDSINEYGTTLGETWSFTTLAFLAPNDQVTIKRLVAAANDTIFFEDE